jgi:hypothetical protein
MKHMRNLAILLAFLASAPLSAGGTNPVHAGMGPATFYLHGVPCQDTVYVSIVESPLSDQSQLTMMDGAPSSTPACNLPTPFSVPATGDAESGFTHSDGCLVITVGPLGPATEVHYTDACFGIALDGVVAFVL